MSCCRCNRSGTCANCVCVRNGNSCINCLPARLNKCRNIPASPSPDTVNEPEPFSTNRDLLPLNSEIAIPLNLPSPEQCNFTWGTLDGNTLSQLMTDIYDEVVHWKRNIFLIPSGAAGKDFVSEIARLLQAYADESSLKCIALKACMVMQVILLQKPSPRSKVKDHAACLLRRLEMWRNGDIKELYKECKCLQARMTRSRTSIDSEQISRTFSNLMMLGKTKSALQFLFMQEGRRRNPETG